MSIGVWKKFVIIPRCINLFEYIVQHFTMVMCHLAFMKLSNDMVKVDDQHFTMVTSNSSFLELPNDMVIVVDQSNVMTIDFDWSQHLFCHEYYSS